MLNKFSTKEKTACVVCMLFWVAVGIVIGHYVWKR